MKYKQANVSNKILFFLILFFLVLINTTITHAETYTFVTKWGSTGSGNGQFVNPYCVAVDSSGNIYVGDMSNNRIQKFDSNGAFITKWGSSGSGNGQFNGPNAIAVDSSGNVYVADTYNNRIQKFDSSDGINYNFITEWGSSGSGNGQFNGPWGVAVDSSGNVYVADSVNNRIQKFDVDGVFITKWGSVGDGDGQFSSPEGVAVDSSGNVYVSDYNHRIQKFDSSDGINYNSVTKWGSYGTGDGEFKLPNSVAVDSSGNVYVADSFNSRIQKFESNGAFITKWGFEGSIAGQFNYPEGIAVDSSGNVYVADTRNNRIQKFAKGDNIPVPTINSIIVPNAPVPVGTSIIAQASIDYQGSLNTLTAVWDWGDGSIPTTQNLETTNFIATHIYSKSGVYTVVLKITDNKGAAVIQPTPYIVVYDSNGGFVTGGGWINSPAGAYVADTSLTGKANFGFNSKYKKGANVPTGNTEFNFKVANLNFHSDNYDWLVVAGAKAQYQGTGTINGQGQYKFKLTAIDGQVNGGGGTDKFRIKIWNDGSGIVYDNNKGAVDNADPTIIIQEGSIIIHK
jgi:sugar lactone lactonase YvrE